MTRVCMLATQHSPIDDRIFYKEGLSLQKAGYEVHMLCTADREGYLKCMGDKRILNPNKESGFKIQGITIHAVPEPRGWKARYLKKISSGDFYKRFIQKGIEINADVYHAHEPISFQIGLSISKKNKAKLIFDSHESWEGGTLKEEWIKYFHLHQLKYLIAANPMTMGNLLARNRSIKAEVIYNYAVPEFYPAHFEQTKLENPVIVHEGILPFNRGLKLMVEAIAILKKDYDNIRFKIVGETKGKEKTWLNRAIKKHGLQNNISETGWVDFELVHHHLKEASIGLICKTPTPNNLLGGPAIKLFNYLCCGIATIDVGLYESNRFLNKTRSGISLQQANPVQLSKAIRHLLEDKELLRTYCQRAYEAYTHFNWKSEEHKLLQFYKYQVLQPDEMIIR